MNTIEKKKIENVIREEVNEKKEVYTERREKEFDVIKDKLTENPPENILKIKKRLLELKQEKKKLDEDGEKQGWEFKDYNNYEPNITSTYDYKTGGNTYHCTELDEHKAETDKTVKALDALVRTTTLKTYLGGEEMITLMDEFNKEIDKIIRGSDK